MYEYSAISERTGFLRFLSTIYGTKSYVNISVGLKSMFDKLYIPHNALSSYYLDRDQIELSTRKCWDYWTRNLRMGLTSFVPTFAKSLAIYVDPILYITNNTRKIIKLNKARNTHYTRYLTNCSNIPTLITSISTSVLPTVHKCHHKRISSISLTLQSSISLFSLQNTQVVSYRADIKLLGSPC